MQYPTNKSDLSDYKKNIHSQFGEDGIIEEVLNRLSNVTELDNWCVEFGAWDGMHLSNTCNLLKSKNYSAVLIEGEAKRYRELCRNFPSENIIKLCKFITFDGDTTLDRVLAQTPIPKEFDFLSIDIDGCDYFILESLIGYKPKIICIEYNPTVPNEVDYIQPKDFSVKRSSSAKSIVGLAVTKGYSLVATTLCNLIFVRSEYKASVIGPSTNSLDDLRDDSDIKTFIFVGQDGTLLTNNSTIPMPWHRFEIDVDALQPLPRLIRRFPSDYNIFQKAIFWFVLLFKFPEQFFIRIVKLKTRYFRKIKKIVSTANVS